MITRRGIFAALFGAVTAPTVLSPPKGFGPSKPPKEASGMINVVWEPRLQSWKRTGSCVMTSDGKELVFRNYDEKGRETRVRRVPDKRRSLRSYRIGVPGRETV